MDGSNFIFITGTGRSGTNILKDILGQHADVATLPFEHRFTVDPRGIFDFINSFNAYWSPYWADYKIKDLEEFLLGLANRNLDSNESTVGENTIQPYADWELNKWIPGYDRFVEQLIEDLVQFNYQAKWPGTSGGIVNNEMYFATPKSEEALLNPFRLFIANCYNAICQKQNRSIFVEDNTHSLLFSKKLYDLFPKAKMIHMVRDPRDVITSLSKQKWAPKNIKQTTAWYLAVMHRWNEQKTLLDKHFYLEVKLEDLINDKRETSNQIGGFIGLQISDCADAIDLSRGNVGRYISDLSASEIEYVTKHVKPILDKYDYQ